MWIFFSLEWNWIVENRWGKGGLLFSKKKSLWVLLWTKLKNAITSWIRALVMHQPVEHILRRKLIIEVSNLLFFPLQVGFRIWFQLILCLKHSPWFGYSPLIRTTCPVIKDWLQDSWYRENLPFLTVRITESKSGRYILMPFVYPCWRYAVSFVKSLKLTVNKWNVLKDRVTLERSHPQSLISKWIFRT
jgi:hypothetical protein